MHVNTTKIEVKNSTNKQQLIWSERDIKCRKYLDDENTNIAGHAPKFT